MLYILDSCFTNDCMVSIDSGDTVTWTNDADSDRDVIVVVKKYSTTSSSIPVTVDFTLFSPIEGADECSEANSLAVSEINIMEDNLSNYSDTINLTDSSCAQPSSGGGVDVFSHVTLPAGYVLEGDEYNTFTYVIWNIIDDCAATACVFSHSGYNENFVYYNESGSDMDLIVIMESKSDDTGDFVAEFRTYEPEITQDGDSCSNAIEVTTLPYTLSGNLDEYNNLYDWTYHNTGDVECNVAHGKDIIFEVTVADGQSIIAHEDNGDFDAVVRIINECSGSSGCIDSNDGDDSVTYTNNSGAEQTIFITLESYYLSETDPFEFTIEEN